VGPLLEMAGDAHADAHRLVVAGISPKHSAPRCDARDLLLESQHNRTAKHDIRIARIDLVTEAKPVETLEFFNGCGERPRLLLNRAKGHHGEDVADELEILQAAAAILS
jgi:hypothetical protein